MPRKTESDEPADWLWFARNDLLMIRSAAEQEISYEGARSKLAEILEKVMKAELIRIGWRLEKTHDLRKLGSELQLRHSDLESRFQPLVAALAEVYFTNRYPGFDLEDPDWPKLRREIEEVRALIDTVHSRLSPA